MAKCNVIGPNIEAHCTVHELHVHVYDLHVALMNFIKETIHLCRITLKGFENFVVGRGCIFE